MEKTIKKITYTEGFEPYVETDPLAIYKWVAEVLTYRHRGSKDIKRITYTEKYDGNTYATYYISNGTKVEIVMPRS